MEGRAGGGTSQLEKEEKKEEKRTVRIVHDARREDIVAQKYRAARERVVFLVQRD